MSNGTTAITLNEDERCALERLARDGNTPTKLVWRARIILATAQGLGTGAIRQTTGKDKTTIWRWQQRYREEGLSGLRRDKTRKPGTPPLSECVKAKVLTKTTTETPPNAPHWSVRTMARVMGISHTSIRRGVFKSVAELEEAIHDYLDRHNGNPKPFRWTKTATTILDKEARAKDKLEQIRTGVSD